MSHKRFYKVSILVMVVASLLVSFFIARQRAIHQAILACDPSYGLQPLESPTAVQAKLTTYSRTISPGQDKNLWYPSDAGRLVWVVNMEGNWLLVGGPGPAEDDPGPFYVHECIIVIDALTGESKSPPME